MRQLVSGEWLAAHLPDVRVVDVRWYLDGRSGRAAYREGHIPGAVWLDIDTELSGWVPASRTAPAADAGAVRSGARPGRNCGGHAGRGV